ncbi:MAG: hypothetical protein IJM75_00145 [Ruminococcus sp.]|nr:hypothetical protein [Ruminococcus sp.]
MNEKCTIFVGGEPVGFKTLDMDHIVHSRVYGADKGYYLAQKLGISCDVVIGDLIHQKSPTEMMLYSTPSKRTIQTLCWQ